MKKYERLFSPIKVGSLTLKNRIVKAPQSSEYWLEGQMITDRVIDLYEGIAEGGASMILIGAILFQPAEPELPFLFGGISDDRHIPGMSALASAVHKHDCHVLVQLHNPGPAPISSTYIPLASTTLTVDQVPLDYCVPTHGVTIEEIMEVCSIGVMMGGGPVLTHMAEVERALNEFYLDVDGEPV